MKNENLSFFSEEIDFQLNNLEIKSIWIEKLISNHKKLTGNISYIFCSDNYLHKINLEHLNHDTLTDIITFDYSDSGIISGDIFISIDRVKENAEEFNVDFEKELLRVMAHGILHLIGYKDKNDDDQAVMTNEENKAIALFDSMN